MTTPVPLTITVYTDIVCPWCLIGVTRLDQALEHLQDEVTATVAHRPFLLDPHVPPGGVKVADMLRAKYGVTPEAAFARVEAEARSSGIDLNLSKQPVFYPTAAAHGLIAAAEARGTGHSLARALFTAYFLEARNIEDPAELAAIASSHGFTQDEAQAIACAPDIRQAIQAAATEAAQHGITGVPFYIFNGRLALSGAHPVTVLIKAIREAAGLTPPAA